MMSFWDGLGGGDFGDKSNHFEIGSYIVKIDRIHTHKGFNGEFLVHNFEVYWSNNGVPQGAMRDWLVRLDDPKRAKMAQADINAFVFAAFGKSKDDRTFDAYVKPLIMRATGMANPFQGGFMKLDAFNIKVGDRKEKDFTKLKWMSADAGFTMLDVAQVMAHPEAIVPLAAPMGPVGGYPNPMTAGYPPPGMVQPGYGPAYPLPAVYTAAAMAPPPPPPAGPFAHMAGWERSPDQWYAKNPATGQWERCK